MHYAHHLLVLVIMIISNRKNNKCSALELYLNLNKKSNWLIIDNEELAPSCSSFQFRFSQTCQVLQTCKLAKRCFVWISFQLFICYQWTALWAIVQTSGNFQLAINSQPIELQSLGNMRTYRVVSWETGLLKRREKQKQELEKKNTSSDLILPPGSSTTLIIIA